ncbi:hypothetical protein LCGC14_0395700 [marine sediment metagenome]|uniref:Uncharacterized protein n=1 Tax=marine sediment metagenome TaxID=412755 RepID=A0A0F9T480_9ZZZZ
MSYIVIEMMSPDDAHICKETPEYGSKIKFFNSKEEAQELVNNCQDGIVINLDVETPVDIVKGLIKRYQETGLTNEEVKEELEMLIGEPKHYGEDVTVTP